MAEWWILVLQQAEFETQDNLDTFFNFFTDYFLKYVTSWRLHMDPICVRYYNP